LKYCRSEKQNSPEQGQQWEIHDKRSRRLVNLNIDIPDEVHKSLRIRAIKEDRTLKEVIVSRLAEEIEVRKKDGRKRQT
jgi:hypothetical protein